MERIVTKAEMDRAREAAFVKWCGILITDEEKAPKTAALVRAYRNAWNAAWQASQSAGTHEEDLCRRIGVALSEIGVAFRVDHETMEVWVEHESAGEGWISVESAPKDGSPVIIGWWEGVVWQERRAWWQFDFNSEYDHDSDTHSFRGAWTDGAVTSFGYEETAEYKPTYYRALPSPPKEKENGS